MTKRNPTLLDRTNLVWEWLLDWDANNTAWTNNWIATNVTWITSEKGYVSEVASFNGTSAYVDGIYSLRWVNTFSISCWINTDDIANYRAIYSIYMNWGLGAEVWVLRISNSWKLEFSDQIANTTSSNTTFVSWKNYYITFVRKTNTTFEFWIDWVLDKSFTQSVATLNAPSIWTWPNIWKLVGALQYWDWEIWNFRIYNVVLTAEQIQNLYLEW